MDKFIDNIVSKPRKKIKEFVAFVKDNYFAPEGVEVDNEDLIRTVSYTHLTLPTNREV